MRNKIYKITTPLDLALRFINVSESSSEEEKLAAATLVELITKVSKMRLQEVFDNLGNKTPGVVKLREAYRKAGVLYADEVPVVNFD